MLSEDYLIPIGYVLYNIKYRGSMETRGTAIECSGRTSTDWTTALLSFSAEIDVHEVRKRVEESPRHPREDKNPRSSRYTL